MSEDPADGDPAGPDPGGLDPDPPMGELPGGTPATGIDPGSGGPDVVDRAAAYASATRELTDAFCSAFAGCCSDEPATDVCTRNVFNVFDWTSGGYDLGYVDVDPAGRPACLDAIARAFEPCSTAMLGRLVAPDLPEACRAYLVGRQHEGDTCVYDIDCGSGSTCVSQHGETPGTCRSLPSPGEPCLVWQCADGGVCDDDRVCRAIVPDGGACRRQQVDPCAVGSHCSLAGRCEPQLEGGRECVENGECASGVCPDIGWCAEDEPQAGYCSAAGR